MLDNCSGERDKQNHYALLKMVTDQKNAEGFQCQMNQSGFLTFHTIEIQLTPDNSNLQGKSKKVRVIGSSKKIAGSKEKNSFYCTVSILITFNRRNVE